MKAWICAVAISLGCAAPAFAQKTDLPDRPVKQITPFDTTAIKEGNTLLRPPASTCTATYVVSVEGKAKDISVDCPHPDIAPYVIKTIETGVWEPEIFDGYFFDTEPIRAARNRLSSRMACRNATSTARSARSTRMERAP